MKSFLLLFIIFLNAVIVAQSNLSIFNNNGQQFYVVLNGIRQNSKPETNVQVSQIKNGSYSVKVIFADGKTPDIDKNFLIDAPYDITTRIIFKKGKGKLQLIGMQPTQGVIQEAVVYRPTDTAEYSDAVVVNTVPSPNTSTIQTFNTTSTTLNTSGTLPEENVNLNMNVSVGGVNLNLNANTTVQTTSATTHQVLHQQQQQQQQQPQPQQQQLNQNTVNCTQTMNRLEAFKAELKDQSFEDDRLEALQLGLQRTCLNTGQAEQLLDLFTFDDNRLAVAKYLSDRLIDRENAGVLAKKLTFESNKMDYRRYISE